MQRKREISKEKNDEDREASILRSCSEISGLSFRPKSVFHLVNYPTQRREKVAPIIMDLFFFFSIKAKKKKNERKKLKLYYLTSPKDHKNKGC